MDDRRPHRSATWVELQVADSVDWLRNLTPTRVEDFVNTNKLMGFTTIFAVANVVILTALGTIFAFLYNLSANILGGLELTLAED